MDTGFDVKWKRAGIRFLDKSGSTLKLVKYTLILRDGYKDLAQAILLECPQKFVINQGDEIEFVSRNYVGLSEMLRRLFPKNDMDIGGGKQRFNTYCQGSGELPDAETRLRIWILGVLSRFCGKLKVVDSVVWIDEVALASYADGSRVLKALFVAIEKRFRKRSCFYVVGHKGVDALVLVFLKGAGFKDLEGVPYLVCGRLWREFEVKFGVRYLDSAR